MAMFSNDKNKYHTDQQIMDVARATLEYLMETWEAEVTFQFKRQWGTYCNVDRRPCHLVFGFECFRDGMRGRKGMQDERLFKLHWFGLNAVVLTVIHEYAHAYVFEHCMEMEYGYRHHGREWQSVVLDMVRDLHKNLNS